ncbi:hypothetical protein H2198_005673 [Neophaeococcomyces mojaviensis]|uniref:Uncharacterized protein n=1 Tax=Neophaeococcomyces mojaviensis TaxID=3383035 RepID=A0ACC3A5M6_9EURO|nr:hypothetical protein H2198_005673 [Knufia sp. JES_112]
MSAPNDEYQDTGNVRSERGTGADTSQNDYASRTGQSHIPVQSDEASVEEGGYADPAKADSDQQLQADEKDAIDQSNIINERTRGAAKPSGTYREPGDEEGLPGPEDGTSRVAGGPA